MAIPKAGDKPLQELAAYLGPFAKLVHRRENWEALERYVTGLLADIPRKTTAAMGRALPETNKQRLHEFLTRTTWEARGMDRMRIGHMLHHASVGDGVLVVDDTGLPKKGTHSVGVARQYSGTLGRVANCQVLVTLHYVDSAFDWPVNAQVYLPESWARDESRRTEAQIPDEFGFATKGQIALGLIDEARSAGIAPRAVVFDAGYGDQTPFLDGLEVRGLPYGAAVSSKVCFRWAESVEADPGDPPPPQRRKRGRPRKRSGVAHRVPAFSAGAIMDDLPDEAWRRVAWREGAKGSLVKQCARVRVYRSVQRGEHRPSPGWLVGERPMPGHQGERKYYFVHGLDDLSLEELVTLLHVRWVIERFYQDAKGELGLDDYEGRRWHGLHRHVALVMLAHCYLALRQSYGPADASPGTGAPARGFPPNGPVQPRRATARSA